MKKNSLVIILLSICTATYSQTNKLKTSLYFSSDKFVLTTNHQKTIKTLLDSIPDNDTLKNIIINKVLISGNTDNDADSIYNIRLSEKRALSVSDFLTENGINKNVIKKEYYGENKPIIANVKPEGKQKNRRVDIYITYTVIKELKKEVKKDTVQKTKVIVVKDTCSKDTTIFLPQGTTYTMNRCDYLSMKDSMKITEYVTPLAIRESGLTTISENNEPLFSGGMWDFKFPKDTCLKKPLTIRVPIDTCVSNYKMSLWIQRPDGRWGNEQSRAVKIVTIDKKKYYEFKILCPGKINIDTRQPKVRRTTFKSKNKLKITEINLYGECPRMAIRISKNKPMKKLLSRFATNSNGIIITAKAITKSGEIIEMKARGIDTLKKRNFLFKRYLLYRKDFAA